MAVLWPRQIPHEIRRNTLRAAECKVYDRLAACLDDRWMVFYSRPWLGLTPAGEETEGEADFVVAHPDLGFLVIEVKGGAIAYDPRTGGWTSTDRFGVVHPIRSPVEQARTSKYRILEELRESRHWQPHWVRIRHGILFPDCELRRGDLGLDMPRHIFCDHAEFQGDLAGWTVSRFGSKEAEDRDGGGLNSDGMRALEKLRASPFHLRIPLGHLMADDDRSLDLLTVAQYQVLTMIEEVPRAAVRGGAGTGKTVLAMESARRMADRGLRVLLTCYNRALAHHMHLKAGSGLEVRNFHSLCGSFIDEAGLSVPSGLPEKNLLEELLPDLLLDGAARLPQRRYDAIVVDEGQDFRSHWWVALDALLKTGPSARLQVFYDGNQQVYPNIGALPQNVSLIPLRLSRNLRNTRPIHELTMLHYGGDPVEPNDVTGIKPEAIMAGAPRARCDSLSAVIQRLMGPEHISPEDIVVLGANESECHELTRNRALGNIAVKRCDEDVEGALTLDTVRRFKGLETRVLVLMATPSLVAEEELIYVALSRARTHLIVIGGASCLKVIGIV